MMGVAEDLKQGKTITIDDYQTILARLEESEKIRAAQAKQIETLESAKQTLSKENKELEIRNEKLERSNDELTVELFKERTKIKNLTKELHRRSKKLRRRDQKIEKFEKEAKAAQKIQKETEEKREHLQKLVEELQETVAKEEARRNKDCSSSSTPTGKDIDTPNSEKKHGMKAQKSQQTETIPESAESEETNENKAANEYNQRDAKKALSKGGVQKEEGQKRHKGRTLTVEDLLAMCKKFEVAVQVKDVGDKRKSYFTEYIVELVSNVQITEVRYHKDCGEIQRNHKSPVIYGPSLKGLCVLLNVKYNLSYGKIAEIVKIMTHGALTPHRSSVQYFVHGFHKRTEEEVRKLELKLLDQEVLCTDATVMVVNGKRKSIRVFCNDGITVYKALETKTLEEMKEKTILSLFDHILVHDHETALYNFGEDHGECMAHTFRYLLMVYDETGHLWPWMMMEFFHELLQARKVKLQQGEKAFKREEISFFNQLYEKILKIGCQENEEKQFRFARQDELRLLNRLKKYKHNELLFLTDFSIPPDNNLSESMLRFCKLKQKNTGGFKTSKGLEEYADIMTILANLEYDKDVLNQLEQVFTQAI